MGVRAATVGLAVIAAGVLAGCARLQGIAPAQDRVQLQHRETLGRDAVTRVVDDGSGPPVFVRRDKSGTRLWSLTREFYRMRGNEPAWLDGNRPRSQADDLIQVLQRASREGLDPGLYDASFVQARRDEADHGLLRAGFGQTDAGSLDVWLTYVYMQYASDLVDGLSDRAHADPNRRIHSESFDPLTTLQGAIEQNRVAQSLESLTPGDARYRALRDALAHYRALAQQGGWMPLPADLRVKPGQHNTSLPALAKRLAVTGDYTGPVSDTLTTYGVDLQESVKRFQRRHGLEPDGVVGQALLAELNVPIDARVRQLELNLERWRWLLRDLGERYVLVNIPEYRLEVWEAGRVAVSMRVVVGKKDTPTPILAHDMTRVVFSPYWNVPPEIARKETVPSVMRDPAFLQRTHMEVIDRHGNTVDSESVDPENARGYRFRQRPGAGNSLGLVKFEFPNRFNVYLHDTPSRALFARPARSFSHGCVRIEEPQALAEYVLRDQPAWTPDRIRDAMNAGHEKPVKLLEPLPVYIGYWTARISTDGLVQFRRDVYGIDARQALELTQRLTGMKAHAVAAAARATMGATGGE